jgi:hypothetical protein
MKKACYEWMWDHAAAFSRRGGYPLQELAEAAIQRFCPTYATSSSERKERREDLYWHAARASLLTRISTLVLMRMKTRVWDGTE